MIPITGGNGFVGRHLLETVKDAVPAPSLEGNVCRKRFGAADGNPNAMNAAWGGISFNGSAFAPYRTEHGLLYREDVSEIEM